MLIALAPGHYYRIPKLSALILRLAVIKLSLMDTIYYA